MNEELIKEISEITKTEKRLIFYVPAEIRKNIANNQIVVLKDNGRLAAFGMWDFYFDGWAEVHSLFVAPEFRGQGYLRKIFAEIEANLKNHPEISKVFFFSRAPAAIHVGQEHGFKRVSYWHLPVKIWLKVIAERLKFKKIPVYLKHGWRIFSACTSQLFIIERT